MTISAIPLTHETIQRAKTIIPELYHANSWIAGSAAARYPQNEDVDVWICNVPYDIPLPGIIPVELAPPHNEEYFTYKAYDQNGLQIMSTYDSIADLLGSFDISCHAVGRNILSGEEVIGTGYSPDLKVVHFQNPITTTTRYLKFAKRYNDYTHVHSPKVQECAAKAFNLFTVGNIKQRNKYLLLEPGL